MNDNEIQEAMQEELNESKRQAENAEINFIFFGDSELVQSQAKASQEAEQKAHELWSWLVDPGWTK